MKFDKFLHTLLFSILSKRFYNYCTLKNFHEKLAKLLKEWKNFRIVKKKQSSNFSHFRKILKSYSCIDNVWFFFIFLLNLINRKTIVCMCVDERYQNKIEIENSTPSHQYRNFLSKKTTRILKDFENFFYFSCFIKQKFNFLAPFSKNWKQFCCSFKKFRTVFALFFKEQWKLWNKSTRENDVITH